MAKFKYLGEDDRYFPTIGVEILATDEVKTFDAPDDFNAHNCIKIDADGNPIPIVEEVSTDEGAPSETSEKVGA